MAEVLSLDSEMLDRLLETETDVTLIIDCRPFLAYNSGHIYSAHNIHCPPIVKRRTGGCLPMENILRCPTTRDKLYNACFKMVVVYDENTKSLDQLTSDSNMHMVLRSLTEGLKSVVYFLKGGYEQFQAVCPFRCISHASTESDSSESTMATGWYTPSSFPSEDIPPPAKLSAELRDTVKYRPSQDQGDPEAILPWLYLGSAYHAMQETRLQKAGINALLNMASRSDTLTPGASFLHMRVGVDDSCTSDIGSWFPEAIDFIESVRKQGGKVLVHCHAGISRSATVCIAYIMWFKHWTMEKAYDYLKSKRSLIAPNLNFMRQLLEFERQLEQNGRCHGSSSTSTHSSSSSYMSASSCECDSVNVGQPCQYCSNAETSQFDFEGATAIIPGGQQSGFASSQNFLHSMTSPFQGGITLQQPPRSASANLFSGTLPHSPGLQVDHSVRPVSAKPVFNLPLTPCTKQANVFSFDSPICSPLSQHTNSPTLTICHSPLVSPS